MIWPFRKRTVEPEEGMRELLELTTKAARRCAYDLKHAVNFIREDGELSQMMRDRADHFLTIFDPANGPKDYRARIHFQIRDLEDDVEELKRRCIAHGIDVSDLESPI